MTKRYDEIMQKREADRTVADMVYLNACNCIKEKRKLSEAEKCGLGGFMINVIWNTAVRDNLIEEQGV